MNPLTNITTREEYDALTRDNALGKDVCPFCDRDSQSGHTVWKGKYWYILRNRFPYTWDEHHLMAVPYAHKRFSHELTPAEITELYDIYKFMKEYFGEKHYFSCTRESMSNRSIEHFHMHFIPWALQGKFVRKMLEWQGFPIQEKLELS